MQLLIAPREARFGKVIDAVFLGADAKLVAVIAEQGAVPDFEHGVRVPLSAGGGWKQGGAGAGVQEHHRAIAPVELDARIRRCFPAHAAHAASVVVGGVGPDPLQLQAAGQGEVLLLDRDLTGDDVDGLGAAAGLACRRPGAVSLNPCLRFRAQGSLLGYYLNPVEKFLPQRMIVRNQRRFTYRVEAAQKLLCK